MTVPLILQIQAAALDSTASITDVLRKAKVACVKLGLVEFGKWIDSELNGYATLEGFPEYRKLSGVPEGHNAYWGWQPIIFNNSQQQTNWSSAHVGMSISAIADSLQRVTAEGVFGFPYPPDVEQDLRSSVNHGDHFRIRLDVSQCANIVHAVRNILLDWTLAMEAQGITGAGLTFSDADKQKSEAVTAQTINNFHISGQVGALAVSADRSVVQGSVEATLNLPRETLGFVQQMEALLPVASLPTQIHEDVRRELESLKQEASSAHPEGSRLRKGLETLRRVLAPTGETLVKLAVDAAVTKLLGHG